MSLRQAMTRRELSFDAYALATRSPRRLELQPRREPYALAERQRLPRKVLTR